VFLRIGWFAIGGLALANSIATGLASSVLLIILRKRLKGLDGRKIFELLWKVLVSVALMGIAIWWLVDFTNLSNGLTLVVGALAGAGIFAISLLVFRVEDFTVLVRYFMSKISRRKA
jgi:putative peptidoglycan lipid II flippase